MKPVLISSKTKQTKALDWDKPLTRYITALYGSVNEFTAPINTLTILRNDLASVIAIDSYDEDSKKLYYKYFGQLELLDLRLPVNDTGVYLKFSWYDAYDSSQHHSQHSLAFEKASVLFNLASVLSRLANEAFDQRDDYKLAIKYMQYAAGVYQFIHDNFLNAPSIDLSNKTISFLNKLMLAQAQELFLLSLVNAENDKYSLIARIAASAAVFYEKANELYLDDLEFGDEYQWLSIIRFKFQFYQSLSYYYQAKALEANKLGESIGYLNLALEGLKHCRKFENHTGILFKPYFTLIEEQIKVSTKENDFIYHHSIPSNESLEKIKPLDSVKPIAINDHAGIADCIGPDLFEKIIPLSVHEKLSLYSEAKAQILREQLEKNDINDKEYESFIEDNNIYKIVGLFKNFVKGKVIDDELFKIGQYVQGSKYRDSSSNTKKIEALKSEITSKLSKVQQLINSSPSKEVSEFNQEVIEIKNSLVEASKIDQKISINDKELQMFVSDDALRSNFSTSGSSGDSLLDMDDTSATDNQNSIQKIDALLRELNNLKAEKGRILDDLKQKIHSDDISQILVLNSKSSGAESQESIFKQELMKFDSLINRFDEILYNSSKTIKLLDKEIENLFQVSKFSEIFSRLMSVIGFQEIFQNFETNFEKSLSFYTHLNEQVLNDLETNINTQLRQSRVNDAKSDDALVERFRNLSTSSAQSYAPPQPQTQPQTQPNYNLRNPSIVSNSSDNGPLGFSSNSPSLPPKKSVASLQSSYAQYNYNNGSHQQPQQQAPPSQDYYHLAPTPSIPLPPKPQHYQGHSTPSTGLQPQTQTYSNYPPQPQARPQYDATPTQQRHGSQSSVPQPQPLPTPQSYAQQQQQTSNATQAFYSTPPVFDNSMYSPNFTPLQPAQGPGASNLQQLPVQQHQLNLQSGQGNPIRTNYNDNSAQPAQRQVDSFTRPYDPNAPYK
ncbi:hypothetical protein WICPIJ_007602 [Wickerhamomyces pijperi]|uniref:BRO domain-containing protein 1 n=1 Tax=Wickerhamomyces pijperi TaxID=599730 RepID=A0A9P8Q1E0_WICPI|nr:hypothetical protein WICPIJ_007602 [Wickerhamomyces pijperi]